MALEKAQRLLVEPGNVLVDGRVRAGLEDEKFAAFDAVLHRLGETRRAHGVVAAKGDLRRRLDTRELSQCIMSDHRARLADESIIWLLRPAAHESRELVDIFRLGCIEFRREAPREDALDDHFRDAAQAFGDGPPAFHGDFEERVGFGPAAVQRQRFDPLRVFAGEL